MIKFLLYILIFFFNYNVYFAQINIQNSDVKWNEDAVILNHEPLGDFIAIQCSNGVIYAAINDTSRINETVYGVKILKSLDSGLTWSSAHTIIKSSSRFNTLQFFNYKDSTYLFSVYDNKYSIINVETAVVKNARLANNWKKAAIHLGSSGNLYMLVDSAGSLYRKTSKDIGTTFFEEGKINDYISDFESFYYKDTIVVSYIKNKILQAGIYKDSPSGIRSIGTTIKFNTDSMLINKALPYYHNKSVHIVCSGTKNERSIIKDFYTENFGSSFQNKILTEDQNKLLEIITLKNEIPEIVSSILDPINNCKNLIFNNNILNKYPAVRSYIFPLTNNKLGLLYIGMSSESKLFYTSDNTINSLKDDKKIEKSITLSQNYPNPFNPSTTISFIIPTDTHVKLSIFDVLGNEIDVLVNEYLNSGQYSKKFNSKNLSSGLYFYSLKTDNHFESKKMVIIK